jgi:uncharacterized membrane protein YgcG
LPGRRASVWGPAAAHISNPSRQRSCPAAATHPVSFLRQQRHRQVVYRRVLAAQPLQAEAHVAQSLGAALGGDRWCRSSGGGGSGGGGGGGGGSLLAKV